MAGPRELLRAARRAMSRAGWRVSPMDAWQAALRAGCLGGMMAAPTVYSRAATKVALKALTQAAEWADHWDETRAAMRDVLKAGWLDCE